jgi:hypothetical protein
MSVFSTVQVHDDNLEWIIRDIEKRKQRTESS